MSTSRMEAFSDGVLAIIITIMVLSLHDPNGSHWSALRPEAATLSVYLLSFVNVGIYWTNHHHLLQLTERVNGVVLWANLHLLFWLSLIPYTTRWVGASHVARDPLIAYAVVLLAAAFGYVGLSFAIIAEQGSESRLAKAIGDDRKGKVSTLLYVLAIPAAFVNRWLSLALIIAVALIWFVPDRRLSTAVEQQPAATGSSEV